MKQPKEYFTNSSFQLPREVRVKLIAFAIGYTEKRFASFFSPIEAGRSPVSLSRSPWSLNRCHRPRLLVGEMDRFGDALPILQKFGFDSSSPAAGSSRHGQLFSDWLFSGRFGLIAATTPFVSMLAAITDWTIDCICFSFFLVCCWSFNGCDDELAGSLWRTLCNLASSAATSWARTQYTRTERKTKVRYKGFLLYTNTDMKKTKRCYLQRIQYNYSYRLDKRAPPLKSIRDYFK
jgi:hypothetical protein